MSAQLVSTIPAFEGQWTIGFRYPKGTTCLECSLDTDPGDQVFTVEDKVDHSQTCHVCGEVI